MGQSRSKWVEAGQNGSKQVKAFVKLGQSMSKQVKIGPRGPKRVKLDLLVFMCSSCHIQGALIGVKYLNWHQTWDVCLLLLFIYLSKTNWQACSLLTGQSISYKYVNQF